MMTLRHGKSHQRTMTLWALVLALLLGQSVAFAHDHHADKNAGSACAFCLFAQQSGHGIPSINTGLPEQTVHFFWARAVTQGILASVVVPFHSRAPPVFTC